MARVMDDTARAKLLMSLLDQQGGDPMDTDENAPTARGPVAPLDAQYNDPRSRTTDRLSKPIDPQTDNDYEKMYGPEDQHVPMQERPPTRNAPQAPGMRGEPMIPVPASLANAGMQALMAQASGGRSMRADGQLAGNLMSDEDMMREMGMSETARNPANKVDPRNLPPVEDPEQVDMIRRGREQMGRNA